jgi:hypothetical protein
MAFQIDMQQALAYVGAYRSWLSMNNHCRPDSHAAKYYHARGITVCERWRGEHGFLNFLIDVGPRPEGTSLDRFPNNDGNYERGNVRWATPLEQRHNQRPHAKRSQNKTMVGKKLTMQKVLDIRARHEEDIVALADEFRVTTRTIQDVLSGKTWSHERLTQLCS